MTAHIRTCSTCVSFDPIEGCLNAVWFNTRNGIPTDIGQAQPHDHCGDHITVEEDAAENRTIALFWKRIGITPRIGRI